VTDSDKIKEIKTVLREWAKSKDCSGVTACTDITEILDFDPYEEPYKGPINQPCSACSAGDTRMEYHDHDYVAMENRR
jgi:hypothetical protein